MQFPTPTPRVRHFLPLMLQELLQWKAPSFWSPLSGLDTAFCVLTSRPNRTQQFQKNMSQNETHLISEPLSKPSTGPSIQSLCMKIDSHSCALFLAHLLSDLGPGWYNWH